MSTLLGFLQGFFERIPLVDIVKKLLFSYRGKPYVGDLTRVLHGGKIVFSLRKTVLADNKNFV